MSSNTQDGYLVNSLERGLEALLTFLNKPEMTFSEFSKASMLNKATAKRTLYTLEKNEFIKYNELNNSYSLGIRLFELGNIALQHFQLIKIAQPIMEKISKEVWETIILAQRVGNEQVYLYKLECEGTVHLQTLVGKRRTLYYGLGKTILAYMKPEEQLLSVPEIMPRHTIDTITERKPYLDALETIRLNGYGVDEEEYIEKVIGIGTPIFQNNNEVCGLIGVTGPNVRMTCEKRETVIKYLSKASDMISYHLKSGLEELV
jgi:DNA-binding IclR family transcriptional regulator